MTTHNTVQYAKRGSVTKAPEPIAPNEVGGHVKVLFAEGDTANVTLAENDLVNLFALPKGARPL